MRALLDSHAFLWAVMEPERLSRAARECIENIDNQLVVSAASALEIATKFRLGKLPSAKNLLARFAETIDRLGAASLPISGQHGVTAGLLRHPHRDPFDRLLAAQAVVEHLPIISQDKFFREIKELRVLW